MGLLSFFQYCYMFDGNMSFTEVFKRMDCTESLEQWMSLAHVQGKL